jgi:hypothetical protein
MHSKDKAEPFTDLVADSVSILYLLTSTFFSLQHFSVDSVNVVTLTTNSNAIISIKL